MQKKKKIVRTLRKIQEVRMMDANKTAQMGKEGKK